MKRKYYPLVAYESGGSCYMIFAKLKRNGIITFKTKRLTRPGTCSYKYPDLDINRQFQNLFEEEEV